MASSSAASLRVLVVSLSARTGGGGTNLLNISEALARREDLELTVHASEELAGLLRSRAPRATVVAHRAKPLAIRLLLEQLRLAWEARRFDVISVVGNFALFACRRPQVLTAQNAWYFTDEVRWFRQRRCSWPMRARLAAEAVVARASIRRATAVVVVSRAMREAIVEDMGPMGKLRVVASAAPPLPAPGRLPPGLPEEPFTLMVAHDEPHKEWDLIARAFETNPDLPPLVIVGRRRRSSLVSTSRVHLLGEVRELSQLSALYRAASCYLAHSRFESFGLTPSEALLAGTPVVVSDIPAHREVCGEAVLYYQVNDLDAMADAVVETIANAELPAARSQGRTWDDTANGLAEVLRDAAAYSTLT